MTIDMFGCRAWTYATNGPSSSFGSVEVACDKDISAMSLLDDGIIQGVPLFRMIMLPGGLLLGRGCKMVLVMRT